MRIKEFTCLLITVLLAGASLTATAQKRAMTTDDGLDMVSVSAAIMSPDGNWVFYKETKLDWKTNKRKSTYHMVPADGGEPFKYIGEAGGSDFRFSPDGTYLSFKRTVEKKAQLFYMRTSGGEAIQLTKHKSPVGSYRWTDDEKSIVFASNNPRPDSLEKEHKNGLDAIFVDEGPNGQTEGQWRHLWKVDLGKEKAVRLTKGELLVSNFDISHQGDRIAFTARTENRRNQSNLSEIYVLSLADTTVVRLTENQAPEGSLRWSPDDSRIAFTAADDKNWELRNGKIWMMNPKTKQVRMVSDAFVGNIGRFQWTPDGQSILFSGSQGTNTNLYRLDVEEGAVTPLTSETGSLSVQSFSKDGSKMVYSFSDMDTSPDLFMSLTTSLSPVRLTTANPAVSDSLLLATAEVIRWNSKDGMEIEGLLILPVGFDKSSPAPLLLHIHGGPAGRFSNSFSSRYHVWAGLGYVQLLPNVRGSSGYSDEVLRGNMADIGGGDYDDLMAGVDYLIREGYVDADRMGIRGWSYGGILGGWTVTQTKRFKAASLGAMVSDWTSEYGPGFNYDVRLWYIGGTPWDNPEDWRRRSALTHAANVTTPTLLLHGMSDRTDTEPQSMMFFSTLKDLGKIVRYIRFPREPHGFKEPRHQRTRDIEEIRWMQKYVLGIEWEPWIRITPKSEKKKDETS